MTTSDYIHTFYAKDGSFLKIRSLLPEDAVHLVDLFNHMGSMSRYLRFNLALTNPDPDLIWAEARRLATIDPAKDGAWLVFCDLPDQPDAPVAGIRFMRISEQTAEASLAVRDDMQNKGIGTELLSFMVKQARAAGVHTLVATIQRGNRAIWSLLRRSPVKVAFESEGGSTTITADLTEPAGAS